MKSVNIAELKNKLSVYLHQVRAGEEILVRDRGIPIARIVPLATGAGQDDELVALAAQGKVRLGVGAIEDSFWLFPAPKVPPEILHQTLDQERNED